MAPTPNFTQIAVIQTNLLAAVDTLGDIWLVQLHPHSEMNPSNMTKPTWSPTLYAVKPTLQIVTT